MKKDSRRSQRVADLVRSEISLLLLTEAHDPAVKLVTVTDVEMPPDLKSARVFFTAHGDEAALERAAEGLARASGYLRREVGRRCGLRYAPELFFVPDRSYDRGARVDEILSQVLPETAKSAKSEEES
jgi:ribosome-binding factor A